MRMMKPVRLFSSYCCSWCVLPRYVLLISDKGMVCETLIHGSLLMQNLRLCLTSKCLRMSLVQRLLRIVGALSALSGHS